MTSGDLVAQFASGVDVQSERTRNRRQNHPDQWSSTGPASGPTSPHGREVEAHFLYISYKANLFLESWLVNTHTHNVIMAFYKQQIFSSLQHSKLITLAMQQIEEVEVKKKKKKCITHSATHSEQGCDPLLGCDPPTLS